MDGIDLDISNGSCWANVNVALEGDYIPCGNVADGNSYACCHYGDNCLSSNACYHARYGITYLAGCTNKDFSGPACQNKGRYYNQPWVGLTRCDPDTTSWAGCPEKDNVVGSSPPTANCKCSPDTILFQDSPMLDNIASLPLSLGGTISWFPNHNPTFRPTSSTTSSTDVPSSTTTNNPSTSTSTPSNTSTPTPGLSKAEKLGIGIGSAFGAIVVGLLVAIAVILRKRKAKKADVSSPRPSLMIQYEPVPPGPPEPAVLNGFKAELPADGPATTTSTGELSPPLPSPLSSAQSPAQSPPPHQYQPYRPGMQGDSRYSNVSQLSAATQGYPESLVSAPSPSVPGEPPKTGHQPDTIHELP